VLFGGLFFNLKIHCHRLITLKTIQNSTFNILSKKEFHLKAGLKLKSTGEKKAIKLFVA